MGFKVILIKYSSKYFCAAHHFKEPPWLSATIPLGPGLWAHEFELY